MSPSLLEGVLEHLCRLDHFLPKSAVLEMEENGGTIDPMTRELVNMLDQLLIRFTKHIDQIILSGNAYRNTHLFYTKTTIS